MKNDPGRVHFKIHYILKACTFVKRKKKKTERKT